MADQVGVDSEKQAAATTHVVESGDAVTSSAQGSSSLGAAQKSMFWGTEDGPSSMGRSSAKLFDTVSDILAKEAELISTFEAEINAALKDFTGTEQDNKLQLARIQEALNRVDKSDAAAALKAAQHELEQVVGGAALKALLPTQSGTTHSTTTGGSTTQAPTQGAQPEV
ncbi:hypothetical protein [Schaalia dentiphila]|jgi:hypothetical protein|uniref:Uncharacterized protein n=1 Tax=Schaalia dentiphila ATCC 17982 TaxID=411466 RepID=A7BBQ0_9ACTO|nr:MULTISPECIES: hypothetical protein [Schaalia]EDN80624.1 hypothetical protein ACTODO_01071 [Schaalia odontolytica ATCC 17982]